MEVQMNKSRKSILVLIIMCSLSSAQVMPMTVVRAVPTIAKRFVNLPVRIGSSFLRHCKTHKKLSCLYAGVLAAGAVTSSFHIPWTWKKWGKLGSYFPKISKPFFKFFFGNSINTELYEATGSGNRNRVRSLVKIGADANAKHGQLEDVPLHYAETVEMAQELINGGANVNSGDFLDLKPLHIAAANGRRDVVRTLLQTGAQVNARDGSGYLALNFAIRQQHFDTVRLLLEHNAVPDQDSLDSLACTVENLPLIQLLIEHGARYRDDNHVLELRNLLEAEAARAYAENREFTLSQNMQQAIRINIAEGALSYPHLFEVLLQDETCDVNAPLSDSDSRTALHIFAERGDVNTMQRLINRGADVNAFTVRLGVQFKVPLFYAIKSGCYNAVKLLLDNNADAQIRGERNSSVLHVLADFFYETDDYVQIAELLINHSQINVLRWTDARHYEFPLDVVLGRLAHIENTALNDLDLQNINSEQYDALLKHASDERALLYLKDVLIAAGATCHDHTVPAPQDGPTRIQQAIAQYLQPRVLALASAQHPRLGAASPASGLPSAITQRVWNVLNGLPIDQALMRNDNGGSNE